MKLNERLKEIEDRAEYADEHGDPYALEFLQLTQALRRAVEELKWYGSEVPYGQFSIVDENRQFVSDLSQWCGRAKQALVDIERIMNEN